MAGSRSDPTGEQAWQQLERLVRESKVPARRAAAAIEEPVQRYFRHALDDQVRLAPAVRLSMRGRIKIGRWLPFGATQLLAPRLGTVWRARVAGVIVGSDRFVAGVGGMDWRILNRVRLVHAAGPDVSRSAAERAAGESIWAPAALWPSAHVAWSAPTPDAIETTFSVDGHRVTLRHDIDGDGRLISSMFERWGDPDRTGVWAQHRFGLEVSSERTFGGVTIPDRGRVGWHFATPRWPEGAFFEFEITNHELMP
jgi:hypothetical protein